MFEWIVRPFKRAGRASCQTECDRYGPGVKLTVLETDNNPPGF